MAESTDFGTTAIAAGSTTCRRPVGPRPKASETAVRSGIGVSAVRIGTMKRSRYGLVSTGIEARHGAVRSAQEIVEVGAIWTLDDVETTQ